MAGYHISDIPKGNFGSSSKIMEEVLELQDAEKQGCKVMALCELSDIYGAMVGYLNAHYPDLTMEDIALMAKITQRAFESGHRG